MIDPKKKRVIRVQKCCPNMGDRPEYMFLTRLSNYRHLAEAVDAEGHKVRVAYTASYRTPEATVRQIEADWIAHGHPPLTPEKMQAYLQHLRSRPRNLTATALLNRGSTPLRGQPFPPDHEVHWEAIIARDAGEFWDSIRLPQIHWRTDLAPLRDEIAEMHPYAVADILPTTLHRYWFAVRPTAADGSPLRKGQRDALLLWAKMNWSLLANTR